LVGIGIAIFAFVLLARALDWRLGPVLSFFEGNLFLPIILVLVGRGMMRRARLPSTTVPIPRQPRAPAPKPAPRPVERPTTTPQVADFPELTPTLAPPTPPPATAPRHSPAPPRPGAEPPKPMARHLPEPGPHPPVAHPGKTSEEMIAEAKRRLEHRKR
jgi:hypothetical protein